jgi:hypothetical protein
LRSYRAKDPTPQSAVVAPAFTDHARRFRAKIKAPAEREHKTIIDIQPLRAQLRHEVGFLPRVEDTQVGP